MRVRARRPFLFFFFDICYIFSLIRTHVMHNYVTYSEVLLVVGLMAGKMLDSGDSAGLNDGVGPNI